MCVKSSAIEISKIKADLTFFAVQFSVLRQCQAAFKDKIRRLKETTVRAAVYTPSIPEDSFIENTQDNVVVEMIHSDQTYSSALDVMLSFSTFTAQHESTPLKGL